MDMTAPGPQIISFGARSGAVRAWNDRFVPRP